MLKGSESKDDKGQPENESEQEQGFVCIPSFLHKAENEPQPQFHFPIYHEAEDTPLHKAIDTDDITQVLDALEKYPNPNVINKFGETPLHRAAAKNNLTIVLALLAAGADPNLKDFRNSSSALHVFIQQRCHLNLIKALFVRKIKILINEKDKDGNTALHLAVITENINAISFLITKEAIVDASNNAFYTPLHLAASMGFVAAATILIEKGHADVNAFVDRDITAMVLAFGKHQKMVDLLIQKGAHLPLRLQTEAISLTRLEALLDSTSTPPLSDLQSPSKTVLHQASSDTSSSVTSEPLDPDLQKLQISSPEEPQSVTNNTNNKAVKKKGKH